MAKVPVLPRRDEERLLCGHGCLMAQFAGNNFDLDLKIFMQKIINSIKSYAYSIFLFWHSGCSNGLSK